LCSALFSKYGGRQLNACIDIGALLMLHLVVYEMEVQAII
jgi:hypothetical protein